jgi:pimeloyl-ACP methyl ester carboxylesterase
MMGLLNIRSLLRHAAVLISMGCAFTALTPAQATTTSPRFERSDCVVEIPKGETVECGFLTVRENRNSRSTHTIKLPIIILKSLNPQHKPDPIIRTLGGPGASSLRMVRGRRDSPWLADRDVIIFEQRGTKYSQPALTCPEVDRANIDSVKTALDHAAARRNEIAAAKVCFERLKKEGIDPGAYNSRESAADIEDLRRTLGYEKVNLYGVSYSARLMLTVMRYYPQGVRSVVLESTLPPEANYDEHGVEAVVRSLNELFTACRSSAECNAVYPDLENRFYSVVATLNKQPLTVTSKDAAGNEVKVSLNGDDFATWIVDYLFSDGPSATVEAPYVIDQAASGKYVEQFRRYAGDKLSGSSYSLGMRYSVWCGEELPFESMTRIRAQSTNFQRLRGYEVMSLPDICSVWSVPAAPRVENTPVSSDIPTLIIAAQYDAYTPPEWGRRAAGQVSRSHFVEIPWAGHGPGFSVPCVRRMIADFFNDPAAKPSTSCIAETRGKFKFMIKSQ